MRPSWTNDKAGNDLFTKSSVISTVARALMLDANYARRRGNGLPARALEHAARCLERVAKGHTWAQAFGWDLNDKKEGE